MWLCNRAVDYKLEGEEFKSWSIFLVCGVSLDRLSLNGYLSLISEIRCDLKGGGGGDLK